MKRLGKNRLKALQLLISIVIMGALLTTTVYWQPLKESREQIPGRASNQSAKSLQAQNALPKTVEEAPNTQQPAAVVPVANFFQRVTKKPFGLYVTPQNSPVQPERFTGYHTGADAEYGDITTDVPVYAIAPGSVVLAEYASGYGGVMVLKVTIKGRQYLVLYGHVRPSSMLKTGALVIRGQQIAVLGTAYSQETDGERRHLHFAVLKGLEVDIKGYVQMQSELSGWYDPVAFLKANT